MNYNEAESCGRPLKAHIQHGEALLLVWHRRWQCGSLCLTRFSSLKIFHVRRSCINLHDKDHSVANTAKSWHAAKIQTRIWSNMSRIKCTSQAFVTTRFYNYKMFHVIHYNSSKTLMGNLGCHSRLTRESGGDGRLWRHISRHGHFSLHLISYFCFVFV